MKRGHTENHSNAVQDNDTVKTDKIYKWTDESFQHGLRNNPYLVLIYVFRVI